MTITYYRDLIQGSDEWLAARCGILTASEVKNIITPSTLKYATNEKTREHVYELISQRITNYIEPHFISDDMMRGKEDEIIARGLYSTHRFPVEEVGFITNDKWGFTLGYSPDGLVGEKGLIEIKSRRAKFQIETVLSGKVPSEFMMQLQTGLLVSGREWIDFISYSGGLPMFIYRVTAYQDVQDAIIACASEFYEDVNNGIHDFTMLSVDMIKTERTIEQEIIV